MQGENQIFRDASSIKAWSEDIGLEEMSYLQKRDCLNFRLLDNHGRLDRVGVKYFYLSISPLCLLKYFYLAFHPHVYIISICTSQPRANWRTSICVFYLHVQVLNNLTI